MGLILTIGVIQRGAVAFPHAALGLVLGGATGFAVRAFQRADSTLTK